MQRQVICLSIEKLRRPKSFTGYGEERRYGAFFCAHTVQHNTNQTQTHGIMIYTSIGEGAKIIYNKPLCPIIV